jgi:hypothetical protein
MTHTRRPASLTVVAVAALCLPSVRGASAQDSATRRPAGLRLKHSSRRSGSPACQPLPSFTRVPMTTSGRRDACWRSLTTRPVRPLR